MNLRTTLMSLGYSAIASVRDTGTTLMRAIRPGDRVDAPNHPPGALAPWPQVDRYPIVLGSRLTFEYIGAAQRIAQTGYRMQWVDLLRELIRGDPTAIANMSARILATAGGRVRVISAAATFPTDDAGKEMRAHIEAIRIAAGLSPSLPEMTEDERLLADQIAAHVQRQIDAIQRKPQILNQQLWAIYYGVSGNELFWDRTPSEWCLSNLEYLHPRRLSYPDQNNWHPHVWDQGFVVPTDPWGQYATSQPFGVDTCDYPFKFLIHTPELISGYPTEDGLGFVLAWWLAAKRMGARSYMQFIERYSKPGTVAKYNTKNSDNIPRNATEEDIALAQQVVQKMGFGGLPGAAIPDSIELELFGPAAMKGGSGTADPKTFAEYCDEQIARAIRTTSGLQGGQKYGSRSALETMMKDANRVAFYDAMGLSATWTRDVGGAITRLNYPTLERLMPTVMIHVDDEPGPEVMLDRIERAVAVGMPIDADKAAQATGLAGLLAAKDDADVRVLYVVKAIEALPPQKPSDAGDEEDQTGAPKEGAAETNPNTEETES